MVLFKLFVAAVAATVLVALAGCGQTEQAPPASSAPAGGQEAAEPAEHAGHEHAAGTSATDPAEALAQLSEADRALAEKQKVCPVSGEPLGSMGKPYKVRVKDRDVFLCCQGCEEEILKNPDKYLAKLAP